VARVRQLACLDFGGPALAPAILRELHEILVFDAGGYIPLAGGPAELCWDELQALVSAEVLRSDAVEEIKCQATRQLNEVLNRRTHAARRLCSLSSVPGPMGFGNLFLQAFCQESLACLIPCSKNRLPSGTLVFMRHKGGGSFHAKEFLELARIEPLLARVLEPRVPTSTLEADILDSTLLIATREGRILWCSPNTESLMVQALGGRWRRWCCSGELPQGLRAALTDQHLVRARDGRAIWSEQSAWGVYTFHVHALESDSALPESTHGNRSALAITVTHAKPRALRLLDAIRRLPLPPRQSEVCFWLAQGFSHAQTAKRVGVTVNTAIYHARQIYGQLNVNSREALLARLLA
jgi:DNA-binding CsgD family transcriptional regulator